MPLFQAVKDPAVDQNFRVLERLFPFQGSSLAGVLKLLAGGNAAFAYGLVGANGSKIGGSLGWTPAHLGVGEYSLTFTKAFGFGPVVVGADATVTQRLFSYTAVSATSVKVVMSHPNTSAKENIAFSFIAIG